MGTVVAAEDREPLLWAPLQLEEWCVGLLPLLPGSPVGVGVSAGEEKAELCAQHSPAPMRFSGVQT